MFIIQPMWEFLEIMGAPDVNQTSSHCMFGSEVPGALYQFVEQQPLPDQQGPSLHVFVLFQGLDAVGIWFKVPNEAPQTSWAPQPGLVDRKGS